MKQTHIRTAAVGVVLGVMFVIGLRCRRRDAYRASHEWLLAMEVASPTGNVRETQKNIPSIPTVSVSR